MGLEPTTSGFTVRRSNQLNYGRHAFLEARRVYENGGELQNIFEFSSFLYMILVLWDETGMKYSIFLLWMQFRESPQVSLRTIYISHMVPGTIIFV